MAKKAMRECLAHGCHNLTREGYCPKHTRLRTDRHKQYDLYFRDKNTAAFYKSAVWKKARELSLARHFGLCQDCLAQGIRRKATMVHHINPLREFPELATVQDNLKPLCAKCHAKY